MTGFFFLSLVTALAMKTSDGGQPVHLETHELGILADRELRESSGIACSHANRDCFWTHNDAGGLPRLFLVDRSGRTVMTVHVMGAGAVDWEDMACFQRAGRRYALIGDVGDNDRRRSVRGQPCTLYVIQEPRARRAGRGAQPVAVDVPLDAALPFAYADGPHNCEAVGVDAARGAVYLVTKEPADRAAGVYRLPLPTGITARSDAATARRIAALPIPTVVAMDVSPDGRRTIVLVRKGRRAFQYVRGEHESWAAAFGRVPRPLRMPKRRHGEAICYGLDGKTLYLTSEGRKEPLWEAVLPPGFVAAPATGAPNR